MLKNLRRNLRQELDFIASRKIDVHELRSVCMTLGPYRNLTTLTASLLFLHPNCQVLNHAGKRIFSNPRLNFFAGYSDEKFWNFTKYAIQISKAGRRSGYGGSIIHSHAFDDKHHMKTAFAKAQGKLVKEHIHTLFWKEPLHTSHQIRKHDVNLEDLFRRNKYIRFLMPVRNPMDCAKSNKKEGHVRLLCNGNSDTPDTIVLDAIFDEFLWFEELRTKFPDRFFVYFENEISRQTLLDIAGFLDLENSAEWCDRAIEACEIKSTYGYDVELGNYYRNSVNDKFAGYPEFAEKLLRFLK